MCYYNVIGKCLISLIIALAFIQNFNSLNPNLRSSFMKVTQVAHTKFTTKGCSQETKQLQSICGTTAKTELSGTEAEPRPGLY